MTTEKKQDTWLNLWVHNGHLDHPVDLTTEAARLVHAILFHPSEYPVNNHPAGRTVLIKDAWDILGPDHIRELIIDHLRMNDHEFDPPLSIKELSEPY